jgi:hypothetical protein
MSNLARKLDSSQVFIEHRQHFTGNDISNVRARHNWAQIMMRMGMSERKIQKLIPISRSTLYKIRHQPTQDKPDYSGMLTEIDAHIMMKLMQTIERVLNGITDQKIEEANLKDIAETACLMMDKLFILKGIAQPCRKKIVPVEQTTPLLGR